MPIIEKKLLPIGEILKKELVIPEYQRPYSWDEEQCDILWTDLIDFYESNIDNV